MMNAHSEGVWETEAEMCVHLLAHGSVLNGIAVCMDCHIPLYNLLEAQDLQSF